MRTFCTNSDTAERQSQIVRDHNQLFNRAVRLAQKTAYRFAAEIHVGLRLGQFDQPSADLGPPYQRPAFLTSDLRLSVRRETVDQHKAEIVPRPLILRARITEPDDQPVFSERVQGMLFPAFAFGGFLFAYDLGFAACFNLRFEFDFLDRYYRGNKRIGCLFNFDALADLQIRDMQ